MTRSSPARSAIVRATCSAQSTARARAAAVHSVLGRSKRALAEQLGVPEEMIATWERAGARSPSTSEPVSAS